MLHIHRLDGYYILRTNSYAYFRHHPTRPRPIRESISQASSPRIPTGDWVPIIHRTRKGPDDLMLASARNQQEAALPTPAGRSSPHPGGDGVRCVHTKRERNRAGNGDDREVNGYTIYDIRTAVSNMKAISLEFEKGQTGRECQ